MRKRLLLNFKKVVEIYNNNTKGKKKKNIYIFTLFINILFNYLILYM